jgi:hypothetical protein
MVLAMSEGFLYYLKVLRDGICPYLYWKQISGSSRQISYNKIISWLILRFPIVNF